MRVFRSFMRAASLLAFCAIALAPARAGEVPGNLPGAAIVTAENVKRLLDSGVLVVDTRVGNEYAESHIKGAVNVPYKEKSEKSRKFDSRMDQFDLSRLPADKNAPIVFYCNAGECWKSYKASLVAIRNGYKQVYWFRGGYPEWKEKGLPVE